MLRSTLRLVAAALLAVGLVFAPSVAGAKSKKSDKKASSRDAKKGSKHDKKDKTAKRDKGKKDKKGTSKKDRRSDDRTAKRSKHDHDRTAKVSKRGKNDGDDDDDRSTRARRTAPPSPAVAKRVVDDADAADADDGDEAEEPPGPKPANRIVADMSPVRVTQIQTALISKGLLAGPPNGVYDQPTFQAMAAFQTRNGWNGVGVPTADSLKALGVPKNSGRAFMTPARVVEATAPPPQP